MLNPVQRVMAAVAESVHSQLRGKQWVGQRVRTSTHRVLPPAALAQQQLQQVSVATSQESSGVSGRRKKAPRQGGGFRDDGGGGVSGGGSGGGGGVGGEGSVEKLLQLQLEQQRLEQQWARVMGSAYSIGTVGHYCQGIGEHLVLFDEDALQPQWVVCQKSTVDVLLDDAVSNDNNSDSNCSSTNMMLDDVHRSGDASSPGNNEGREQQQFQEQKVLPAATQRLRSLSGRITETSVEPRGQSNACVATAPVDGADTLDGNVPLKHEKEQQTKAGDLCCTLEDICALCGVPASYSNLEQDSDEQNHAGCGTGTADAVTVSAVGRAADDDSSALEASSEEGGGATFAKTRRSTDKDNEATATVEVPVTAATATAEDEWHESGRRKRKQSGRWCAATSSTQSLHSTNETAIASLGNDALLTLEGANDGTYLTAAGVASSRSQPLKPYRKCSVCCKLYHRHCMPDTKHPCNTHLQYCRGHPLIDKVELEAYPASDDDSWKCWHCISKLCLII